MNEVTQSEKGVSQREQRGTKTRSHSAVLCERRSSGGGGGGRRASELTVKAMRLKGSIIAARAYKRKGGVLPLLQGVGDTENTDDVKIRNRLSRE